MSDTDSSSSSSTLAFRRKLHRRPKPKPLIGHFNQRINSNTSEQVTDEIPKISTSKRNSEILDTETMDTETRDFFDLTAAGRDFHSDSSDDDDWLEKDKYDKTMESNIRYPSNTNTNTNTSNSNSNGLNREKINAVNANKNKNKKSSSSKFKVSKSSAKALKKRASSDLADDDSMELIQPRGQELEPSSKGKELELPLTRSQRKIDSNKPIVHIIPDDITENNLNPQSLERELEIFTPLTLAPRRILSKKFDSDPNENNPYENKPNENENENELIPSGSNDTSNLQKQRTSSTLIVVTTRFSPLLDHPSITTPLQPWDPLSVLIACAARAVGRVVDQVVVTFRGVVLFGQVRVGVVGVGERDVVECWAKEEWEARADLDKDNPDPKPNYNYNPSPKIKNVIDDVQMANENDSEEQQEDTVIRIKILMSATDSIKLQCRPTDTIESLKIRLRGKFGGRIPRLIFDGETLEGKLKVSETEIEDGDSIEAKI